MGQGGLVLRDSHPIAPLRRPLRAASQVDVGGVDQEIDPDRRSRPLEPDPVEGPEVGEVGGAEDDAHAAPAHEGVQPVVAGQPARDPNVPPGQAAKDAAPAADTPPGQETKADKDAAINLMRHSNWNSPLWNWSNNKTVSFVPRRLANELSIHRWDAENAGGDAGEGQVPLGGDRGDERVSAKVSPEAIAQLVNGHREFLAFLERRVGSPAVHLHPQAGRGDVGRPADVGHRIDHGVAIVAERRRRLAVAIDDPAAVLDQFPPLLSLLGAYQPRLFDLFHTAVWQIVIILAAIGFFLAWSARVAPARVANSA